MDEGKRRLIADALAGIVQKARHGGPVLKVGLMATGSELGAEEILRGALAAQESNPALRVTAIGPRIPGFDDLDWMETPDCEADVATAVDKAIASGAVAGVVAMHYPFPIGVTTIGRVLTPGRGKPMLIASCTGASAPSRGEALLRNAVYGVATAKSLGIARPTVALLNQDGAGPVSRALARMREQGYDFAVGASLRGDGGALLRGNDLVSGAVDVLVCDTLTGNVLIKLFSTFSSGGQYESVGWGYGPSVGEGWKPIISIVSRASGAPVIANAIAMTARSAAGGLPDLVVAELKAARAAGFDAALEQLKPKESAGAEEVKKPPVVPVDAEISGVDVMDMEAAVQALWKEGVYAESAMGCTGPVVRVQASLKDKSVEILKKAGFI
ncbi:MAG: glycine reductase [Deltaproteobacteria bacterium]|jgi:betaine reductase|nr:glycine reductase [Deltaproteobacteria bacterium]